MNNNRNNRHKGQGASDKKHGRSLLPFVFCLVPYFICSVVMGQELSNVGKAPLLKVDGGISLNQDWHWSDVPGAYRQPYSYTLVANLNLSVYGWSIPLSGMFSNKQWSYQQPFNQFSVNPSYKWIHLYMGYNSMSFSSYTLNGHRFFGGGVEVTPSTKWKISAMAGCMQERVLPDSAGYILPAFYRFGSGLKTEYTFTGGNIALSTFYAKDDPHSLAGYDSLPVTPAENLAIALNTTFTVLTNFKANIEYSTSLFTEDIQSPFNEGQYKAMPLYSRRTSTHQYNALKSNFNYSSSLGSIGVGYERVEPGFRTLGAYTTVNDFENYTLNYAGQIVAEKVSLATSIGLQRDDLTNTKAQDNKRWVGSLSLGFTPVKAVNASLMYGNFRNYTHVRTGFENINNTTPYPVADTLDYTQISETMGATVSIAPTANETTSRSIIMSVNYQQASEQQSDNLNQSKNRFVNGMFGYNHTMIKQKLNLSTSINMNRNRADSITTLTIGPMVSARKAFFDKKMNTSLSVAYNRSLLNSKAQSEVYIVRGGLGYTLKERHAFDFSAIYAKRTRFVNPAQTNDVTLTLTYRYNFKGKVFDFKKHKSSEVQNGSDVQK
jgi:hypothetical protein